MPGRKNFLAFFTPTPIMFYLYILKRKIDSQLYIGSTNDLRKRLRLHNGGKIFSTRLRCPFEVVYHEAYKSEIDARRREKSLKLRSRSFAQLKNRLTESLKT